MSIEVPSRLRAPPSPLFRLRGQELPLSLHAPLVARDLTVAAHDAMTGNDDRDAVAGARSGDRAAGLRLVRSPGHLGVRTTFAGWNFPQRVPDSTLELGAGEVEGDSMRRSVAWDRGRDRGPRAPTSRALRRRARSSRSGSRPAARARRRRRRRPARRRTRLAPSSRRARVRPVRRRSCTGSARPLHRDDTPPASCRASVDARSYTRLLDPKPAS